MLFIFKEGLVFHTMKLLTINSLEIGLRVSSGNIYLSPN
jgi:hypothetical protein